MNEKLSSKIIFSISMVIFGTIGFFTRNISVNSGELALYRAILAEILIIFYLIFSKQKISIKDIKNELLLLLLSGTALGIDWILFFESFKHTTISIATLSYYFAPVIVILASSILFKEKLTLKQIICFIMSTIGLIMITGIGNLDGSNNLVGILFALGAAAFYATVILLNKHIKYVDGIQRTFWQFLATIIVLLPYVTFSTGFTFMNLDFNGWVNLLIVGFVHTGIAYCMYFPSLKEISGQKAAILSYIDPLVAVIISVVVLKEAMTFWQIIGGILILGFTLWNELS